MLKMRPRHGLQLTVPALAAGALLMSAAGGCNLGKPKDGGSAQPISVDAKGTQAAKPETKPLSPQEQMVEDYGALGYRLDWIGYATVMPKAHVKHAETLGDVVGILDSAGALTVINVRDGTQRWSHMADSNAMIYLGLVRVGDSIVTCEPSLLRLFDVNTGTLTQKQQLDRAAITRPAQLGGLLFFGTSSGRVLAHSVTGGYSAWTSMIDGPVLTPPAIIGHDTVAVVSTTGEVLILDAQFGSMRGHARLFDGTTTTPVSDDDTLYIASTDQSFYALARVGGRTLWRIRTEYPLQGQPNYYKGTLLAQMPDGFQSIDAATGKVRWTNKDVTGTVAAIRRGRAIVWNGDTATTVDLTSGQTVTKVALPGTAIIMSESGADGPIYLVTPAGQVTRLVPR